jgi:hypothetical protein
VAEMGRLGRPRAQLGQDAAGDASAARIRPSVVTWGPASVLPCYTGATDTISITPGNGRGVAGESNRSCVRTRA